MANPFTQEKSLLLARKEDAAALAKKDCAHVLVVSDSHGAVDSVVHILRECGAESDALLFTGDGGGDIALLSQLAADDAALAECVPPVIALVQGNNDAAAYQMRTAGGDTAQVQVPLEQVLTVCGHKVFLTHGHRLALYGGTQAIAKKALSCHAAVALYGHTHIAASDWFGHLLILNAGSCSRPRSSQPPAYARLTLHKGSLEVGFSFYALTGGASIPFTPARLPPLWG